MKAVYLLVTSAALFSLVTFRAQAQKSAASNAQDVIYLPGIIPQGQGCCSYHGGECGCSDGRDVCCDGTYSPTCSCHSDQLKPDELGSGQIINLR
jgi:hypothetical protein